MVLAIACLGACTSKPAADTNGETPVASPPSASEAEADVVDVAPAAPKLGLQWGLTFGTPFLDRAECVAIDEHGVAYVAFFLDVNRTLAEGDAAKRTTLTVVAIDPEGAEQWRQSIEGPRTFWTESMVVSRDGSLDIILGSLGTLRVNGQQFDKRAWVRLARADGAVQRAEGLGEAGTLVGAEDGDVFVTRTDAKQPAFLITRRDLAGTERWTTSLSIESAGTSIGSIEHLVVGAGMLIASGTVNGELVVGEQRAGEIHQDGAWIARIDPHTGAVAWVRVMFMADMIGSPQVSLLASGDILALTPFPNDGDTIIRIGDELLPRTHDRGYDISRLSPEGDTRWRQTFGHDSPEFESIGFDHGLQAHPLGDRVVLVGTVGVAFSPGDPRADQLGGGRDAYLGWLDEDGKLLRSDLFGTPRVDRGEAIAIAGDRLLLLGAFSGPMRIGETTLEPAPPMGVDEKPGFVPPLGGETLMSVFIASFEMS